MAPKYSRKERAKLAIRRAKRALVKNKPGKPKTYRAKYRTLSPEVKKIIDAIQKNKEYRNAYGIGAVAFGALTPKLILSPILSAHGITKLAMEQHEYLYYHAIELEKALLEENAVPALSQHASRSKFKYFYVDGTDIVFTNRHGLAFRMKNSALNAMNLERKQADSLRIGEQGIGSKEKRSSKRRLNKNKKRKNRIKGKDILTENDLPKEIAGKIIELFKTRKEKKIERRQGITTSSVLIGGTIALAAIGYNPKAVMIPGGIATGVSLAGWSTNKKIEELRNRELEKLINSSKRKEIVEMRNAHRGGIAIISVKRDPEAMHSYRIEVEFVDAEKAGRKLKIQLQK